ncbi:MAG: hypothetical protein JJ992_03590, partial [Planctomycetes bacterium]|nr:hypothetical protein [Planctomycetota bacterium]
ARVFAARTMMQGGASDVQRIRWAWQQTLSRTPTAQEIRVLQRLLDQNRAAYRDDPAAAALLIDTGLSPAPADLHATDLAAWTAVTRAILNLNETITRN